MHKKNILNLALLLIVAGLAAVIFFSEEENTALDRLTAIKPSDITSILIRHNKNKTLISRQDNDGWQITQPVDIAANGFRINSILKLINAPVHNKYSADKIDLKSIGLDSPDTTIKFNDQLISFGITNPATGLRYIKLGNTVYTIQDMYYPLLSSEVGTLVSLDLLPKGSHIKKLILVNQTITKDEKGRWQSNINISADNINKTIDHWLHDQAFGVHTYLKRKQLGTVYIYLENRPHPVSYVITDTDPWLILARPDIGLEYNLDIEAYDKLVAPQ